MDHPGRGGGTGVDHDKKGSEKASKEPKKAFFDLTKVILEGILQLNVPYWHLKPPFWRIKVPFWHLKVPFLTLKLPILHLKVPFCT